MGKTKQTLSYKIGLIQGLFRRKWKAPHPCGREDSLFASRQDGGALVTVETVDTIDKIGVIIRV